MMNGFFASVPTSKNKTASYRRIIKSSDINEKQENLLRDILELYNKSNTLNNKLNHTITLMDYENKFLRRKIEALENKFNDKFNEGKINNIKIFPSDMNSNEDYPVEINYMSYDLSQNIIKRISKINIYDELTGKTIIPASLNATYNILYKTNSYLKFSSNELLNAFDGQHETGWLCNITTNNSVNSVQVEVIVTLPVTAVTSYQVNEIIVESFPVASVNVKSIQYSSSYISWTDIPSFDEHYLNDGNGIKDNTVARFNFKPIEANKIRIVLEQPYFANKNNLREFCLGAKDIQINYTKPSNQEAFFNFKLNIPETIKKPTLNSSNIIYNNPSQIDENTIELEYFYRDNEDVLHKINGTLPLALPSNEIEVKGKIYQCDNTVNLSHIDFNIGSQ